MRYFIDTNVFLFLCDEPEKLTSEVKKIIFHYENQFIMGVTSVFEILTHIRNQKVSNKVWRSYDDVKDKMDEYGIEIRYIAEAHVKAFGRLTPAPNHSDPADLMIIAQAIAEKIPLISSDKKFPFYTGQGLHLIHNRRKTR